VLEIFGKGEESLFCACSRESFNFVVRWREAN